MLLWNDPSSAVVARFAIAGDFLPASGLKPVGAQTWSEMARPLVDAFGELDFALVNLESPVNVGSLPPRTKPSLGDTFNAPQEALDYLRALQCKVVSLANNHTYDYDWSGVATTEGALKAAGIVPLGISQNLEEPPSVHVLNLGDNARIGIWCSALGLRECATKKSAGLEPATIERGKAALSLLKSQAATCCVAFLHAGAEGTNRPDPGAVKLMDSLAHEGFDLIAACHSHRTSGFADVARFEHSQGGVLRAHGRRARDHAKDLIHARPTDPGEALARVHRHDVAVLEQLRIEEQADRHVGDLVRR